MANHKSARKRSRQSLKRKLVNRYVLSKIKRNKNKFDDLFSTKDANSLKDPNSLNKSLSILNSSLSRAAKRGIIKKKYVSRKLSSLSSQLKKLV